MTQAQRKKLGERRMERKPGGGGEKRKEISKELYLFPRVIQTLLCFDY